MLLAGCALTPFDSETYRSETEPVVRANRLSVQHMASLKRAFVGREFVFRMDWFRIYEIREGRLYLRPEYRSGSNAGGALASAGDVAKITGFKSAERNLLWVIYVTESGKQGGILINSNRKTDSGAQIPADLSDGLVTVAWLESQLTAKSLDGSGRILEFVRPLSAGLPPSVELPEAGRGLVLQNPGHSGRVSSNSSPAAVLLAAGVEPAKVRRGGMARLTIAFSVEAKSTQQVAVDESYLLTFNGRPLPGFPVHRSEPRGAGEHRGVYVQRIPEAATPGTYSFKAEICAGTVCNNRVTEFEITP